MDELLIQTNETNEKLDNIIPSIISFQNSITTNQDFDHCFNYYAAGVSNTNLIYFKYKFFHVIAKLSNALNTGTRSAMLIHNKIYSSYNSGHEPYYISTRSSDGRIIFALCYSNGHVPLIVLHIGDTSGAYTLEKYTKYEGMLHNGTSCFYYGYLDIVNNTFEKKTIDDSVVIPEKLLNITVMLDRCYYMLNEEQVCNYKNNTKFECCYYAGIKSEFDNE